MPKGDRLGEFELFVMLALAHLGDDAYGAAIRREIQRRTARETVIGAVYATLARLEDKGLVRHLMSPPLPIQGGRSRKCFRLTASGDRAVTEATTMLTQMMQGWRPRRAY